MSLKLFKNLLDNPELNLKYLYISWAFVGFMGVTLSLFIYGDTINLVSSLGTIALSFGLYRRNNIVRALTLVFCIIGFLLIAIVLLFAFPGEIEAQILAFLFLLFYTFSIFQLGFNKGVKRLFSDKNLKAG